MADAPTRTESESTALFLRDRPPKLPAEHLRGFERFSVPLFDLLNSVEWVKRAGQFITRHISKRLR